MAAIEMYDYLAIVAADNNQTLDLKSQRTIVETGTKKQEIHEGDDGSEERIDFGTNNITNFKVSLQWVNISESNAGTLMLFWNDSSYGSGKAKSFKWINYGEPAGSRHTYVVRFDSDIKRDVEIGYHYGVTNIVLKVLGKIS